MSFILMIFTFAHFLVDGQIEILVFLPVNFKIKVVSLLIVTLSFIAIVILLNFNHEYGYNIKVRELREFESDDNQTKVFKCIIENTSSKDIYLNGMVSNYRYYEGACYSLGEYRKISYDEEYVMELEIDTSNLELCMYLVK
ncbi:hypothetical protein JOC73_000355 [Alkaliphilus hydrothermalis]|uniref:Uncharacterized protein n=1 Tax=Alkaliphilus hydrothermalis TaxID=1482730 RepID=A0ABS2NLY2_9FIRM|nr:hypothetical protein [Alkaliphilus hydrothermalis]